MGLAESIAAGDLTQDFTLLSDDDELGKALEKMIVQLRALIGDIHQSSVQIASGSAQVPDSSSALSQGATEQASSPEEISASMTEMRAQVAHNAKNASQAKNVAVSAREAAERGNDQMQQMVGAMEEINASRQNIGPDNQVINLFLVQDGQHFSVIGIEHPKILS